MGLTSSGTGIVPDAKRLSPSMQHSTLRYNGCALMLVKFEIYSDSGYWCSRGIGVDIFTQGKTLDELMENIREAVMLHFEDELGRGENIRILSISETEVGTVARAAGC
jgi:predicted RNase H-like HicB family nuclease